MKSVNKNDNLPVVDTPLIPSDNFNPQAEIVYEKLTIQKDLATMIRFATIRGIPLPSTVELSELTDETVLMENYNSMVDCIKPSTVQAIRYVQDHILNEKNEDRKWYQTPIIAKCLMIAGFALISLITISLSPQVNEKNLAAGLLASEGLVLLYNLIFICSASLLGVMFYLLKTISDKIKSYTLLPVDAIEVNTTILIGVISGFIISELFTFNPHDLSSSLEMQKMTLALIGGFSSDAIFSVLKGVVNKMKMFFAPENA